MQTRRIGTVEVSAIGLGAMPMSLEGRPEEERSVRTVHAALDAGVTLIDVADAYSRNADDFGHNEELVARALREWPGDGDGVLVATKGGHTRAGDGSWELDGRPEYLRAACEASLRRLGVEAIGLYQFHRPDPRVPTAESVGALRELQDEGKIRMAGVSNFNNQQIEEAAGIVELAAVQNQLSPAFRSSLEEVRFCHERGVAFLAWSPLGGISSAGGLGGRHRSFARVAEDRGVSPQQVALAWSLAQAPAVIPIPGSSRPETILDSLRALDLELTADELALLDRENGSGPEG